MVQMLCIGAVSTLGAQLSAQQIGSLPALGPVDISNLVVDGAGSGVDCSTGLLAGIAYLSACGSLDNVEVRNQTPGGCGFGILLGGSPYVAVSTVNIRNSRIHEFDNTGILAASGGATTFLVNLTSNLVESASTSVQAGVEYETTDGLAARNIIVVDGQVGLLLDNFFGGMTATENTIFGSNVGILSGSSLPLSPTIITHNNLLNNGTGIFISGVEGSPDVESNIIVQSSTAGIDLDCSAQTTAAHNRIFGAPVGIANISSGDILTGNTFFNVTTATSACPDTSIAREERLAAFWLRSRRVADYLGIGPVAPKK
jgi:hypothetical protein